RLGDNRFYNSFNFMRDNALKLQTHYTPNVLGIYLLMRVMEQVENASTIAIRLQKQAAAWYGFFDNHAILKPLVTNPAVRSDTVIAVTSDESIIRATKKRAETAGITLGNGYGTWKNNTFRIANFPAISTEEINSLMALL
ncbi:MAG: alanine--glyoxylate aminotransferase family protein, partial [Cytophagales bacterium]|nr:alanine--glyoxylate aminotransferase family protein [Cytophagales bacterium]